MGNEIKSAVRVGKERYQGKILLESNEIIFKGADLRLKIPFSGMQNVSAVGGELRVQVENETTIFEVGAAAEKWKEKILHPKARVEKLGVKPGTRVQLVGKFDAALAIEIAASKAEARRDADTEPADVTLFAAESLKDFPALAKYAKKIRSAQALWVVYPKGKKEITEMDVITVGRRAGLKDVKVVGFSGTHTALKFVLPLDKR